VIPCFALVGYNLVQKSARRSKGMASGKAFNRFTKKDLSEFLVEKKILDKDEAKELEGQYLNGLLWLSASRSTS
jgi:hypothetical protein